MSGAAAIAVGACGKGRPKTEPVVARTVEGIASASAPPGGDQRDSASPRTSDIPRRALGRTGEQVSIVGLGGFHLGNPSAQEAIRIMHRAIDVGITFFDNCWDYHRGESERRMGRALEGGKRQQVFLMTKLDGRTKQAAAAQLEQSLRRLKVDMIDLVQIHEVIREKDPEWVFGGDGAIAALQAARQAGKIRFIGFTGHKDPSIHLDMLRVAQKQGFRYDTVQMPLNVMDPHYRSFEKEVLPVLLADRIGVLGMKPLASGEIVKTGRVTAIECLHYAMSLPTSVVITGCEKVEDLEQAIDAARSFQPLTADRIQALLAKTRELGSKGEVEAFKTSERFDATARNEKWLTGAEV